MSVDLGCGPTKRGEVGVDRVPGPGVDVVCAVGFEPLPFPDASVDRFVAYDFLEHLPVSVWAREANRWVAHYPRIQCLREIYRCLVPGGTFFSQTPGQLPEWAQDPTHEAPPWVPETWRYFCGGMGAIPAQYGIDFAFAMLYCEWRHHHLLVEVQRPDGKPAPAARSSVS